MTSCGAVATAAAVDVENCYESLPYETGNHYCGDDVEACKTAACRSLPARSRQTLPVLPTTPSLALREPRLTVRSSSPESEMSYVVLETRRIRLILVIGLGAMILLQFLQLILTSTSEVGLLKAYEMTGRNMRSFETHHHFLCFCAT